MRHLIRLCLLALLSGFALARGATAQVPHEAALPPPLELRLSPALFDWDPVTGVLSLKPAALPPDAAMRPVINPADTSPEAGLLRRLVARGEAAGLAGVFYDNRDRRHSALPPALFPQLTRLVYGPAFTAQRLDYGLAGAFRFPAITFGNSSTAVTSGPFWRSLPRLAMTAPGGPERAWADYAGNAIYVYPEHRDHDATDLYPAAWPYMLASQGSSGSDQPFLRATGLILAALRPDTRARLEALGLVAPTVQMIFRRAQIGVHSRADYLSGAAHPSAFVRSAIAPFAMVALANSLTPDTIPPVVRLAVVSEDFDGRAGLKDRSERLFDTPSAIARVWRSWAFARTMTVSATNTKDPNGRPLHFTWVLLRGDPARVQIMPLDAAGTRARLTIDWQEERPAPLGFTAKGPAPMTNRVDIGVFANNGVQDSAPAFISICFPNQQQRRYEPAPDGTPRLAEIDYDAKERGAAFDPALFWSAPWRDHFHYDVAGKLTGWTREATTPASAAAAGEYSADGQQLH